MKIVDTKGVINMRQPHSMPSVSGYKLAKSIGLRSEAALEAARAAELPYLVAEPAAPLPWPPRLPAPVIPQPIFPDPNLPKSSYKFCGLEIAKTSDTTLLQHLGDVSIQLY